MEAEAILGEATAAYRAALGDRLLAAYALGSLAHGGFSALVSDIDLGLIVRDPLRSNDAQTIEAIAETEKAKGSTLHGRLSVFWGTPVGPAQRRAPGTGQAQSRQPRRALLGRPHPRFADRSGSGPGLCPRREQRRDLEAVSIPLLGGLEGAAANLGRET
jgi:hypothetical protein